MPLPQFATQNYRFVPKDLELNILELQFLRFTYLKNVASQSSCWHHFLQETGCLALSLFLYTACPFSWAAFMIFSSSDFEQFEVPFCTVGFVFLVLSSSLSFFLASAGL